MRKYFHKYAFLLLIVGISVAVFSYFGVKNSSLHNNQAPVTNDGVIDLTQFNFSENKIADIQGSVEFYWMQLLGPDDFMDSNRYDLSGYIDIHGVWNSFIYEGNKIKGNGFATYRFFVKLSDIGNYGFKIREYDCAYRIFINGRYFMENGKVGRSENTSKPCWKRREVYFDTQNELVEVVLQVSNFSHRKGGTEDVLKFGKADDIRQIKSRNVTIAYFLFGVFVIMFIYHLVLFVYRSKDLSILYFSAFVLFLLIRLLCQGEKIIYDLIPEIPWALLVRIEYLSYTFAVPAFLWFIWSFYPNIFNKLFAKIVTVLALVFGFSIVILPVNLFSYTPIIYQFIVIVSAIYTLFILVKGVLKNYTHAMVLFAGFFFLFVIIVNDVLYYNKVIDIPFIIPLGLFVLIFSQAFVLAKKTSKAYKDVEILSFQLDQHNRELESKVDERTKELRLRKEEIQLQKTELEKQASELIVKNTKLIELDKFKEGMNSMIVHDLKNPLNVILNITNNNLVQYSANRMLNMVQNILDIQKYEDTMMEIDIKRSSIFEAVKKALTQVEVILQKKGINFKNEVNDFVDFDFDENAIIRVIVNLLTNAIKFTPANGDISIGIDLLDNSLRVFVKDTGIGIAKEKHDQMFLKYGQIIAKRLDKTESTGLGLAFCKLAIEAHNGEIGFNSEKGKGATFWFELPCKNCKEINNKQAELNKLTNEPDIKKFTTDLDELLDQLDVNYLMPFVKELKSCQIYELSALKSLINKIDNHYSVPVYLWVEKLIRVVDSIDEISYLQLLLIIEKQVDKASD